MANVTTPKCTGNCMNCAILQRQFCASQLAYNNMKALEAMTAEIKSLSEKVNAMQNNDTALFNPTIAQEGDGAEE